MDEEVEEHTNNKKRQREERGLAASSAVDMSRVVWPRATKPVDVPGGEWVRYPDHLAKQLEAVYAKVVLNRTSWNTFGFSWTTA